MKYITLIGRQRIDGEYTFKNVKKTFKTKMEVKRFRDEWREECKAMYGEKNLYEHAEERQKPNGGWYKSTEGGPGFWMSDIRGRGTGYGDFVEWREVK